MTTEEVFSSIKEYVNNDVEQQKMFLKSLLDYIESSDFQKLKATDKNKCLIHYNQLAKSINNP